MLEDRFGGQHTSDDSTALAAFEEATLGVLAHRPGVPQALDRALAADPAFAAAHALKGLAAVILARAELLGAARAALGAAEATLAARGGTPGERALADALAAAAHGGLALAAARLERHLVASPHDLLAMKLAHALRFMLGDAPGMLAITVRALPAWGLAQPGYGFALGCHAFALEECGELRRAETVGREAVRLEPHDAWGMHAVAHTHEMTGHAEQGIAWLEGTRAAWSRCNNFSFHLAWHLALFHLERGRHERVLELYDTEVRPQPTDDFRDVANAVSLLWRLEQEGVAVGRRWAELAAIARRRRHDIALVFASLHYLLALVAGGDLAAAHDLATALGTKALAGEGDQAGVAARVGVELAHTLLGLGQGHATRLRLGRLAAATPQLGGSHAQRDLFIRTLALLAAERGDRSACERVMAHRRRLGQEGRFARLVQQRLEAARPRQERAA